MAHTSTGYNTAVDCNTAVGCNTATGYRIEDLDGATCLGRTCLKWGDDGELSDRDFLLVMERLSNVDGQTCLVIGDPGSP